MKRLKLKAWDKINKIMCDVEVLDFVNKNAVLSSPAYGVIAFKDIELLEYTDLEDKNGNEYYLGDIGRFDNGDTFTLKMEDWREVYADWIGEPKCSDQVRDLYRIERAKIIGNIFENPELLS